MDRIALCGIVLSMELVAIILCLSVVLLCVGLTGLVSLVAIRTVREENSKSAIAHAESINAVIKGLAGINQTTMQEVSKTVESALMPVKVVAEKENVKREDEQPEGSVDDMMSYVDWTDELVGVEDARPDAVMIKPGEAFWETRNMAGEEL